MKERKQFLIFLILCSIIESCRSKSIQNYNATVEEIQNERISNIEKSLHMVETALDNFNSSVQKGFERNEAIMFYAIIYGKHFVLNSKSTVVFEKVILNIGQGYNNYDGVFVAPRSGVYLFSWTISIDPGDYTVTELVVENDIISSTGDTATNGDYHSTSMTSLCRMNKEDHAFIRTTSYGGKNSINSVDNYPKSSFMGMLVREE